MPPPQVPKVFTFYSYKGGVGRSMALLNVAYKLASWGRHVLMIDMDLEAPGISGFLERNEELAPPAGGVKDVLTLLAELKRLSTSTTSPEVLAEQLPSLSNYLRSVKREKLASLKPELGDIGRLDILGPDLHRNYEDRLASLGLAGTSQEELIAMSRTLHFYLKAQRFPFAPDWLKEYEDPKPTPYDYVLVDSRTGITEIGGLCIGPLADALVVLTGLNDQNVEGTKSFLQLAGIHPMPDSALDASDKDAPTLGPKPTLIVASPVPNGELTYRKTRLEELEKQLGSKPSRLSYHPQLALMETVFVRDYPDEYLAFEYNTLTERLLSTARDTAKQLDQLLRDHSEQKVNTATLIQILFRHAPANPELAKSLLSQLSSLEDSPNNHDFAVEVQIWAFLTQSRGHRIAALANLAISLSSLATTAIGEKADYLFSRSYEKYDEVLRLKPDHANARTNWGIALVGHAKTKAGDAADALFAMAYEKFQEEIRLQPVHAKAWRAWGVALSEQANTKVGEAADALFALAYEKYQEALRLMPDDADAWSNWGGAISVQAATKAGVEADDLFAQSYERYQVALRLRPNHADAWSNWGYTLGSQAKTKAIEDSDLLLHPAREKLLKALSLGSTNAEYNIAFIEAMAKKADQAVSWLEKAKSSGYLKTKLQIAKDPDFDQIRSTPVFQAFLANLPDA